MRRFTLVMLVLVLGTCVVFGAPAWPKWRTFHQPDGYGFKARLVGDEHFHYALTEDGYAIMQNEDGWWCYAYKEDGLLYPSDFIVGRDACPYPTKLHPDAEAVRALPKNQYLPINWRSLVPPEEMGELVKAGLADTCLLVLLGEFLDSHYVALHDSAYWDSVFFAETPGSFRHYYEMISYNNYHFAGAVRGPREVYYDGPGSAFDRLSYFDYGDGAETRYIGDAIDVFDPTVDFSQYDHDNDGYVDHCIVLHCGGEQAATGNRNDMWALCWLTNVSTNDGVSIHYPMIVGELTTDDNGAGWDPTNPDELRAYTMGIGVDCHETYHSFGAPDLYDYGYSGTPVGVWSLMDAGSWNDDGVQAASRPAYPSGLIMYDIDGIVDNGISGFMDPSVVDTIYVNGTYEIIGLDSLPGSSTGKRLYIVRTDYMLNNTYESFYIEYRTQTGFYETYLPEAGLIIGHFDGDYALNDGPPGEDRYGYWIEQIGFDPNPIYASGDTVFNRQEYTCPFSADDGEYQFTDWTTADNLLNIDLATPGPRIYAISNEGKPDASNTYRMTFTVGNCNVPANPVLAFGLVTVYDTITNYGNNDGVLNPDEKVDLVFGIINTGSAASNAEIDSMVCLDPTLAEVVFAGPAALEGALNTEADTAYNASTPLRVKVYGETPAGTSIPMKLYLSDDNGSYETEFALYVSPVQTVAIIDVKGLDNVQACAVDIMGDTLFVSGAGIDFGDNSIYAYNVSDPSNPTLVRSFAPPSAVPYVVGLDHDSNGLLYMAGGDSCYQLTTAGTVLNRMRWHNTSWGAANPVRFRGVTVAPTYTVHNDMDSLYGYWQTYDALVESLFGETKNWGGTATAWYKLPLTDGHAYDGSWNNGRGLEHDGIGFWTNCLFTSQIQRRSYSDFGTMLEIYAPSVYGIYNCYDVAFEPLMPNGPYAEGGTYYLYTASMDEGAVYKTDVTAYVLPTPVENVVADYDDVNGVVNITWDANPAGEVVSHYIIYRSDVPDFYPTSAESIDWTTGTSYTDVPPKAVLYYKVRAVNVFGYSQSSGSDSADVTTQSVEAIALTATSVPGGVELHWRNAGYQGASWEITRRKRGENAFETVGSVGFDGAGVYKFVDKELYENGIYEYQLVLNTAKGGRLYFAPIRVRFTGAYVFSLAGVRPNPVRGSATIVFTIPRDTDVSLKIYDASGRVVKTLVSGELERGIHKAVWDGTNDRGSHVATGTYFYRLVAGDNVVTKKMLFVR